MSTLLEIEAAAVALPPDQREDLLRFLTGNLCSPNQQLLRHYYRSVLRLDVSVFPQK